MTDPERIRKSVQRLRAAVNGDDFDFEFVGGSPFDDVQILLIEYDRLTTDLNFAYERLAGKDIALMTEIRASSGSALADELSAHFHRAIFSRETQALVDRAIEALRGLAQAAPAPDLVKLANEIWADPTFERIYAVLKAAYAVPSTIFCTPEGPGYCVANDQQCPTCPFSSTHLSPPWDAHHNRSYGPVETAAKEIYDFFEYKDAGTKPAWVPGGNSLMQDEARICARKQLRDAGHTPALSSTQSKTGA